MAACHFVIDANNLIITSFSLDPIFVRLRIQALIQGAGLLITGARNEVSKTQHEPVGQIDDE
jgi:hypothetical protein